MITTTTVGCHPISGGRVLTRNGPDVEPRPSLRPLLEGADGVAQLERMAAAQIRGAIAEQEALGLDILSEGEVTRGDYWSYFVVGLEGTQWAGRDAAGARVRVTAPLAPRHTHLIDDWKTAQRATRVPVKVTIPGPLTCATYVEDRCYGSQEALSLAFARTIGRYVRLLADAGCRYIQIDDCQLAYQPDAAIAFGLAHVGLCFEGIGPDVTRLVHICRGTPSFPTSYDGCGKAPDPRCYEALLPVADGIAVDVLSVEHAFAPSPASIFEHVRRKTVMLGVISVATLDVESPDEIVARALPVTEIVGADRLMLAPDCGFFAWNARRNGAHHDVALQKLGNLVEAARRLNAI